MEQLHHSDPIPRFGSDERAYLLKRADDHRRLADASREAGAQSIHRKLQRLYEARADATTMVGND